MLQPLVRDLEQELMAAQSKARSTFRYEHLKVGKPSEATVVSDEGCVHSHRGGSEPGVWDVVSAKTQGRDERPEEFAGAIIRSQWRSPWLLQQPIYEGEGLVGLEWSRQDATVRHDTHERCYDGVRQK